MFSFLHTSPEVPQTRIERLRQALRDSVKGKALVMDRRDTSFVGTADDVEEVEVINAVKSVPTHY